MRRTCNHRWNDNAFCVYCGETRVFPNLKMSRRDDLDDKWLNNEIGIADYLAAVAALTGEATNAN